jgi:methyl-accepting chemotaxis protein
MKKHNLLFQSIQFKLAILVGFCLMVICGTLIAYSAITARDTALDNAKDGMMNDTRKESTLLQQKLESAMILSRSLADELKAVRTDETLKMTRAEVDSLIHQVGESNPQLNGIYTIWEPYTFDNLDTIYANQEGHDATGRYISYFSRTDKGELKREVAYGYDTDYFYQCPKTTLNECISNPTVYKVQGKDTLLTSITVPIITDGQFYGIVGVDIDLSSIQDIVNQEALVKNNETLLISSNNGSIVGITGKPELMGKKLEDSPFYTATDLKSIQAGEEGFSTQGSYMKVSIPIPIGSTKTPWSAIAYVPSSVFTSNADQLTIRMVLITLGFVLIGFVVLWFTVGQVVKRPLGFMVTAAKALSTGDLNGVNEQVKRMAQKQKDELGDMSRSFVELTNTFVEKIVWYEALLDSIPLPVSATDMNMNWTFINHAAEKMVGAKRAEVLGHQCSEWNTNLCKNEDCAISRLRQNYLRTVFEQNQKNFQVDTSYILNSKGEQVGHIEIIQDITRQIASTQYQSTAVEQLGRALSEMASGRLAFEIPALPPADENTQEIRNNFFEIHRSLENARDTLHKAIEDVIKNAEQMEGAANQLSSTSVETESATNQIATTIQEVAKGISQQTTSVTRTVDILSQVHRLFETVEAGTQAQGKAVKEAANVASAITGHEGISDKVNRSAQTVQEMGNRSEQIGNIVATIEDIASQTNLLALNAAIEAARAGEHGKGFAVVADEVRKLAERSSAATKEISSLIKNIQSSVQDSVNLTTTASTLLNKESQRLMAAIEEVTRVVEENSRTTEQLLEQSNKAMEAVENIASISEENSAAAEEVSASTEEMSAQVEELSNSAKTLNNMAEELRQTTGHFRLN